MWEWSDCGNTFIFCWLANHMTSARKPTLHNSFFVPLWHKADFIFYPGWREAFSNHDYCPFRDLSIKGSSFPVSGCGHFVGQIWWFIDQVTYHRLTNDRQYMRTGLKSASEALVCVVYTLTVTFWSEVMPMLQKSLAHRGVSLCRWNANVCQWWRCYAFLPICCTEINNPRPTERRRNRRGVCVRLIKKLFTHWQFHCSY